MTLIGSFISQYSVEVFGFIALVIGLGLGFIGMKECVDNVLRRPQFSNLSQYFVTIGLMPMLALTLTSFMISLGAFFMVKPPSYSDTQLLLDLFVDPVVSGMKAFAIITLSLCIGQMWRQLSLRTE